MNNRIKEILDRFDKKLENYELDKKFGQLSIDSICHLFPSEIIAIKDYITSLQEKEIDKNFIKECGFNNVQQMALKLAGLQEENERLKERCDYLQRSCDRKEEQRDDARMEYMEQEDYKARCEKIRNYVNSTKFVYDEQYKKKDKIETIINGGE